MEMPILLPNSLPDLLNGLTDFSRAVDDSEARASNRGSGPNFV